MASSRFHSVMGGRAWGHMSDLEARRAQVLVALGAAPLDRIRLMKTVFLIWHRGGRPEGPFHWQPYLYGPCAFELYEVLDSLEREGLIWQMPGVQSNRGVYKLTPGGLDAAASARDALGHERSAEIVHIAQWASSTSFTSLLRDVYDEAPDFAVRSIL